MMCHRSWHFHQGITGTYILCFPISSGCDDLVAQLLLVKNNTKSVLSYGLWPVKLGDAGVVVLVLKLVW